MGRRKIEIKKIEHAQRRKLSFLNRQKVLFKKADELAILCDAQIAVIIFSDTGKMAEFSTTNMQQILARYKACLEMKEDHAPAVDDEQEESKVVHDLKEEISNLKAQHQQIMQENETLHRQVGILLGFPPSTTHAGAAAQLSHPTQQMRLSSWTDQNMELATGGIQASNSEIQPDGLEDPFF